MRGTLVIAASLALVPVVLTGAVQPAAAAMQKYERKSISVLTDGPSVLNRLYFQAFEDLGRFDYDAKVLSGDLGETVDFLRQLVQRRAGDRAGRMAAEDVRFHGTVISGEDIDRICKAAYLLVPRWSVGQPTILSRISAEVDRKSTDRFTEARFTALVPVTLRSTVIRVEDGRVYATFAHTHQARLTFTRHFRTGDSDGAYRARTELGRVLAQLERGGLEGVLQAADSATVEQALLLQSPDRMAARGHRAAKSGGEDELAAVMAALPGAQTDPEISRLEAKERLNPAEMARLERLYERQDRLGASSPAAVVLAGVKGAVDETIKSARGLDAFTIKGPVQATEGDTWQLGYGNNTGIDLDTWFRASVEERDADGRARQVDKGYMKIRSLGAEASKGQAIIVGRDVEEGDQLTEIPMLGTNITVQAAMPTLLSATGVAFPSFSGGGVHLNAAWDMAPYLYRLSGKKVQMPELYGTFDATGFVPLAADARNSLGFGYDAEVGLLRKVFFRSLALYGGLKGGVAGFSNDLERTGSTPQARLYVGGGLQVGVNWQITPSALLELGVGAGAYVWSPPDAKGLSDILAAGRILVLAQPRAGLTISF